MVRICSDCQVELRQVETNFLEIGQVWEAGFAPVALEAWACPRCSQVRFYAANVEELFSQRASDVVPLTLKEAYGEVLPVALEWHESVRLCAVYSGDDEDAYVDMDGLCPTWSFTFCDSSEQYLDLVLIGRIVERSPYEFDGESGAPFALEDLMDSPEIIAQARGAGLQGEAFTLALERDEGGTLRAVVVGEDDQQVQLNPLVEAPG
ncbi:MAG: hypothetical protein ACJ8CR_34585 [Roseiflexaceae bacterium]